MYDLPPRRQLINSFRRPMTILTTDQLFLLACALRESPATAADARKELTSFIEHPAYRTWRASLGQARPFKPPTEIALPTLRALGLLGDDGLVVCVNDHKGRLFLTDGVWADPTYRAFPFNDESAVLVSLARRLGWSQDAGVIVDLASGCGHSALSFDAPRQYLLDINPRALAYAELNKLLNDLDGARYQSMLNDIRQGMSSLRVDDETRAVLVVANMPFAPAPRRTDLPLTSYGGPAGMDLQVAAFRALARLRRDLPAPVVLRALVMGLSVGDSDANSWDLHRQATEHFGAESVRWFGLEDEQLLRVDGKRALSNPCPARVALPAFAQCHLYTPDPASRAERKLAFERLAQEHEAMGNPDIAYGVVAMELA